MLEISLLLHVYLVQYDEYIPRFFILCHFTRLKVTRLKASEIIAKMIKNYKMIMKYSPYCTWNRAITNTY